MFSKTCEYAIRAGIHVAEQSLAGKRVSLKDLAREIDSPEAFTAKIMQQLSKNNIVRSLKGPTGGFEIDEADMKQTMLIRIVSTIDGNAVFSGCGLGLKLCSEDKPCPVHDKFKQIRNELRHMLETTSLYELATGLSSGTTFLKR